MHPQGNAAASKARRLVTAVKLNTAESFLSDGEETDDSDSGWSFDGWADGPSVVGMAVLHCYVNKLEPQLSCHNISEPVTRPNSASLTIIMQAMIEHHQGCMLLPAAVHFVPAAGPAPTPA